MLPLEYYYFRTKIQSVWKHFESLVLMKVSAKCLTWSKRVVLRKFLEGADQHIQLLRIFNGTSSLQLSAKIWKKWRESWTTNEQRPVCTVFWTYMHCVKTSYGSRIYDSVLLRFAHPQLEAIGPLGSCESHSSKVCTVALELLHRLWILLQECCHHRCPKA